ncbi:hypothetical protein NHX12_023487, partial [Muraenolepis orangiensis]
PLSGPPAEAPPPREAGSRSASKWTSSGGPSPHVRLAPAQPLSGPPAEAPPPT